MVCSETRPDRKLLTGCWSRRPSVASVCVMLIASIAPAKPAPVAVSSARLVYIDGTEILGTWIGCEGDAAVKMKTQRGIKVVPLDDVATIEFSSGEIPASGDVVFHLADGGRLHGDLVGDAAEAIVGRTILGDAIAFGFDHLAGVEFVRGESSPRAAELFRAALHDRRPGQDRLVTRSIEDPRSLGGTLEALSARQGLFHFGGRTRTIRTSRIYGVVFASGAGVAANQPVTVELADGSSCSGRILSADSSMIRLRTSMEVDVDLSISAILRLTVRSRRVVYVSDRTPLTRRLKGRLHRPWPIRSDRSVSNGPLSIAGRVFQKGLGVHSQTELVYDIGGEFETFVATIGIDDAVRPRGSVVFRVLGDETTLFDSGLITGRDEPRRLVADVSGVEKLTLVVSYGDGLDLSDHADWGGARLLRPSVSEIRDGSAK